MKPTETTRILTDLIARGNVLFPASLRASFGVVLWGGRGCAVPVFSDERLAPLRTGTGACPYEVR